MNSFIFAILAGTLTGLAIQLGGGNAYSAGMMGSAVFLTLRTIHFSMEETREIRDEKENKQSTKPEP